MGVHACVRVPVSACIACTDGGASGRTHGRAVCVCVCAVAGEGRLQRAEDLAVERLDDRRVLHEAREFLPVLARLRHCLQLRLHLRVDHVRREVEREQPVGLIQQVDDCAPEPAQVPELAS